MDEQQLPQEFCANLGSKHGHSGRTTGNLRRTVKNGEEQWNPKHGSTMERRRDLRVLESCGDRRRFIWSRQVDAAAGVGEDKKTRGGGGGGARAQHSGERKKMEVAR